MWIRQEFPRLHFYLPVVIVVAYGAALAGVLFAWGSEGQRAGGLVALLLLVPVGYYILSRKDSPRAVGLAETEIVLRFKGGAERRVPWARVVAVERRQPRAFLWLFEGWLLLYKKETGQFGSFVLRREAAMAIGRILEQRSTERTGRPD